MIPIKETSETYIPKGYILDEGISKKFARLQCRACSNKMIPHIICLDCNEPTVLYCCKCEKRESFEHKGHQELHL